MEMNSCTPASWRDNLEQLAYTAEAQSPGVRAASQRHQWPQRGFTEMAVRFEKAFAYAMWLRMPTT